MRTTATGLKTSLVSNEENRSARHAQGSAVSNVLMIRNIDNIKINNKHVVTDS